MFGVEGIGHAFLVGAIIGGLLTFVVTGGITLLATSQWGPSVAVGGFLRVLGWARLRGHARSCERDQRTLTRHRRIVASAPRLGGRDPGCRSSA